MRLAGKAVTLLVVLAIVAGCTGLPVPATEGKDSGELTPVELVLCRDRTGVFPRGGDRPVAQLRL